MTFANAYGGVREDDRERNENDHYPTPPLATYALLKHSDVPKKVWEPATGRGWMAGELERNGFSVTKSDLFSYPDPVVDGISHAKDFLHPNLLDPSAEAVITNPPYGRDMAQKFAVKACEEYRYVAMLCRLMFAESMKRHEMFTNTLPPSDVYVFSGRFSCEEKSFLNHPLRGMISYAWWVWDYRPGKPKHPRMHWIDTKQAHQDWLRSVSHDQLFEMRNHIARDR